MKRRRILSAALALLLGGGGAYYVTGYHRGRADFEAVARQDAPQYALFYTGLLDGGTEWFRGRGYSVYRMHRILTAYGNNPPEGYLGGSKIVWWFPIRLFASDDDRYFYIPENQESTRAIRASPGGRH